MKSVPLNAYPRTHARRGEVKKLRATGRIPAVIYGRQQTPQNLEVTSKDLKHLIHHSVSENLLVDLSLGVAPEDSGDQHLVKEWHPIHEQVAGS